MCLLGSDKIRNINNSHSVFQKLVIAEAFQPVALRWTGKDLFVCHRLPLKKIKGLIAFDVKPTHVPGFYLCPSSVYQVPGTYTSAVTLRVFNQCAYSKRKKLTLHWKTKIYPPVPVTTTTVNRGQNTLFKKCWLFCTYFLPLILLLARPVKWVTEPTEPSCHNRKKIYSTVTIVPREPRSLPRLICT